MKKGPMSLVTPGLERALIGCHERKGSYGGKFAACAKQPVLGLGF